MWTHWGKERVGPMERVAWKREISLSKPESYLEEHTTGYSNAILKFHQVFPLTVCKLGKKL